MTTAIDAARPGSTVGFVGAGHGVEVSVRRMFERNVGLAGGMAPVRRYLPELLDLVLEGKIDPGRVFDLTLPLDKVARGLPGDGRAPGHQGAAAALSRGAQVVHRITAAPGGSNGRCRTSRQPLNQPRSECEECSVHRLQRVLNGLVDRVDTPSPIVLADVMQRNIDRMQGFAAEHDLELRPHVKTHKCVEVGRRQVDAGAVGITAGNVGEAEVFAAAGFDDIFLAYPVWPSGTKGDRIRRAGADRPDAGGGRQRRRHRRPGRRHGGRAGPAPGRGGGRVRRPSFGSPARGRGRPRPGRAQARAGAGRGLHLSRAWQRWSGFA